MKNAALRSPRGIDMDRLFSNRLVPQVISAIEREGKQTSSEHKVARKLINEHCTEVRH
jgi:hypothetical protein